MDPADLHSVREELSNQGSVLGQHGNIFQGVMEELKALSTCVTTLQAQLNTTLAASTPPAAEPVASQPIFANSKQEPMVPTPERYDGNF